MISTNTLIFWFGTLSGISLGVWACCVWKNLRYVVFALLIACTFFIDFSINLISRESYRAASRGIEIHIVDLFLVILFFTMYFLRDRYQLRFRLPMLIPMFVMIAIGFVSWLFVEDYTSSNFTDMEHLEKVRTFEPYLYPLFELFKMLRGIFFFFVIANFLQDQRAVWTLFYSLATVVILVTIMSILNRYVFGQNRVTTGGYHPNDLNSYVGIVGMLLFPMAFASKRLMDSLLFWVAVGGALVTIVLTISRSSLAAYLLGAFIVYCVCLIKYASFRNVALTVFSILVGLLVGVKAIDTLGDRFFKGQSTSADLDNRYRLSLAAYYMGQDHLFGVGLGNYHYWAIKKYAAKARSQPETMCHNMWYLTYGELGIFGLIAFIGLWIRFYQIAIYNLFKSWGLKNGMVFALVLGVFCASEVLQFQNLFHFSYRSTSIFYLVNLLFAISARVYIEHQGRGRKAIR